jgi:subtilisin family serine protease
MKNFFQLSLLSLFIICFLVLSPAVKAKDNGVDVLISSAKPYKSLIKKIESAGGTVRYQYKNIDAIAATIPRDKLSEIQSMPGIDAFVRDVTFSLGDPPSIMREGFGKVPSKYALDANQMSGNAAEFTAVAPEGYFPTEVALTRAFDFWMETGHFGEDVIVGIMDTGTADVPAISGRVIGGESFLFANPGLEDGLGPMSPSNDPHGTWVATTLGADAIFGFFATSAIAQSLKIHLPAAILPDFFAPGIDGVPMVGQAPSAEFFALKIFNVNALTSDSIILAAFDRVIELKQQGIVDIQVLNGSFGGPTLNAAEDPFFAAMVKAIQDVGIVVCFSAGNAGPSAITAGDPGVARNTITAAATSVAAYEKILIDAIFGVGMGNLWRANDTHQTAISSSRGPTADGRTGIDITAPGDSVLAQGANGGIYLVSGTSFSSPMVAGAAALLLSEHPGTPPDQIRAALLNGANPNLLEDNSGPFDQGFGFLDVIAANAELMNGSSNPKDQGIDKKKVKQNIEQGTGVRVINANNFYAHTGDLKPGQRSEYFYEIKKTVKRLIVTLSNVTPELPPSDQNPLFGDDLLVAVHSAKTSSMGASGEGDYRVIGFVNVDGATIVLEGSDLDVGIARITVMGDWTNAGNISANVSIVQEHLGDEQGFHEKGRVGQGGYIPFLVDVPAGASELRLRLVWDDDWGAYPTDDLDMLVYDPYGNLILLDNDGDNDFDGLSFDSPERLIISSPAEGAWTIYVNGYTVWEGMERFEIYANIF